MIIAIKYEEPSWKETLACIEATGACYNIIERNPKGLGSLAEVINRAAGEYDVDFAWIVTNVTFERGVYEKLRNEILKGNHAAIHPAMASSDHEHERPDGTDRISPVPFVEFTAAMVNMNILRKFPLDEQMPYWGHDIDWGYRLGKAGYSVAVDHSVTVDHTYIRNAVKKRNPITLKRRRMRTNTDYQTRLRLINLYGKSWKSILQPSKVPITN